MVAILHSEILVLAILDSAILVFTSKTTHTCQDWFPPFAKKLHSFIQTQLDDGSHLKICHVGFRHCYLGFRHLVIFSQIHSKHSHSTLILTQTNSIWLTWRWQPYRILPSWIWPSWIQPFCTKKTWLIHSHWTWWWQPSWILPCWIQTLLSWIQIPCYLLSDLLKNTLSLLWLWLKLFQSDRNSFILT